jgi:hypothetical protein
VGPLVGAADPVEPVPDPPEPDEPPEVPDPGPLFADWCGVESLAADDPDDPPSESRPRSPTWSSPCSVWPPVLPPASAALLWCAVGTSTGLLTLFPPSPRLVFSGTFWLSEGFPTRPTTAGAIATMAATPSPTNFNIACLQVSPADRLICLPYTVVRTTGQQD